MSKKRRELTSDEKQLWRRVAASVKSRRSLPLEPEAAEAPSPPKRRTSVAEPAPARAASRVKPLPEPQNRGNEKRIRRGKLEIGGKLDLHGHTQDSARTALARFLRAAQRRGERTVIIITGVGRSGEGVLKKRLPEWMSESDIAALVAGYAQAHRAHGGAGAFYVFLKRAD